MWNKEKEPITKPLTKTTDSVCSIRMFQSKPGQKKRGKFKNSKDRDKNSSPKLRSSLFSGTGNPSSKNQRKGEEQNWKILNSFKPKLFDDRYRPQKKISKHDTEKNFQEVEKPFVSQKRKESFQPTIASSSETDWDTMGNPAKPKNSSSNIGQGMGPSQSDDYLENISLGAQTLLKTREFVYYSYYNRIKQKLRQHWEPKIQEKARRVFRRGRGLAGVSDRITRLVIILNRSGELMRIQVRSSSGYMDLDEAAIEAFRAAAPFPNPPKGIIGKTGEVKIHWDFVLET